MEKGRGASGSAQEYGCGTGKRLGDKPLHLSRKMPRGGLAKAGADLRAARPEVGPFQRLQFNVMPDLRRICLAHAKSLGGG